VIGVIDCRDIYVHDRVTGTTSLVNVANDARRRTDTAGIRRSAADGRYVAFESGATNLVPDDTNDAFDASSAIAWPAPRPRQCGDIGIPSRAAAALNQQ